MRVCYTGRDAEFRRIVEEFTPVVAFDDQPCDLGLSIIGSHIFTADEIARARCGIANLHLAPLPEYRGRYSAAHAINEGAMTFGVTLHYVDEGIDTGPIIAEDRFAFSTRDVEYLKDAARLVGMRLLRSWLPGLLEAAERGERLPAQPQDESRARYFSRAERP